MPITVWSGGVFQTKVGTSHILTITNTAGVFQFKAEVTSLIAGDNVTFRARTSVLSGFGVGPELVATFIGSQTTELLRTSVPLTTVTTAEYVVNVTSSGAAASGTGSNGPPIAWSVLGIN